MSIQNKRNLGNGLSMSVTILFVFLASSPGLAKSVYMVNHSNTMNAYTIEGDQIEHKANVSVPVHGWGPIDVTIDPASGILFVTHEKNENNIGGNVIELFSGRTLLNIGTITLSGPTNLSGIIVDGSDPNGWARVYTIDRRTDDLFVYLWDPNNLEFTCGKKVELANITHGCGLALDEESGYLYVSEFNYSSGYYNTVQVYDRDDNWSYVKTITVPDIEVGEETIELNVVDIDLYIGDSDKIL